MNYRPKKIKNFFFTPNNLHKMQVVSSLEGTKDTTREIFFFFDKKKKRFYHLSSINGHEQGHFVCSGKTSQFSCSCGNIKLR